MTPSRGGGKSLFFGRLDDLSITKKFVLIFNAFFLIILSLFLISYFGMSVLSHVRAYIAGESIWSKAQKDAVYHLSRYLIYEEEKDYEAYLDSTKVPLGDRIAREELEKPNPDLDVVSKGLIEGKNHPDDVRGMAILFTRFSSVPYIEKAFRLWQRGESLFTELMYLGQVIGHDVKAGTITPVARGEYLRRIDEINEKLTPIEEEFSTVLGEGARWLKKNLIATMVIIVVLLLAIGLALATRISRQMIREIHALRDAAERISKGDFSAELEPRSRDEIGELTARFQEMKVQRQKMEQALVYRARELNKANERLIESERSKNDFFTSISHELRTPLTLVLSPIETLLSEEHGPMSEENKNLLKTMHNNTARLLQLVNGLLDFSKLEAGRMELHREPVDLVEITQSILSDFKPLLQRKKLKQEFIAKKKEVYVYIDRYVYERILFNLMSNAMKFTPAGGKITVSLTHGDGTIRLSVADTGIGIRPEEQQNIFQKFRQIERSSARRHEGTGLGLALVKEFAELLQGHVSVTSEPGKGSVFMVEFPAAPAERSHVIAQASQRPPAVAAPYDISSPAEEAPPLLALEPHGMKPKVLIAEDNADMAAYLQSILSPFCQVAVTSDGEEALKKARGWNPDLVLSDIMMPKKDGLTFCREMKSSAATASIPVVLLTALTDRDALMMGWEAGADDYLFKPFHPKELTTRVKTLLSLTTERRRSENRIKALNDELERKVEDRTRGLQALAEDLKHFAFIAAHDLREPLRKIRMFGDLLKEEGGEFNDAGRAHVGRIQDAAKRMEALLASLQRYSNLDRQEESMEMVNLNLIVKNVLSDLEIQLRDSGATVRVDELPTVPGYRAPLAQLFQNLLSNAVKFRSKERPPVIDIRARTIENNRVEIRVRDNGIGMEERFFDQIFKPFQRLHTRTEYEGVGMGLSICKKIVQQHDGSITVESKVGDGSTFCIMLPMAPRPSPVSISA